MRTFVAVFVIALLGALLATPLVIRWARRWGLVDEPGTRKVHRQPVPRVGGIAIAVPMLVAVLPALWLDNGVGTALREVLPQVVAFFAGSVAIFAMGLWDDVRGLRARTKFAVQFLAATAVFAAGVRIETLSLFELGVINLGWLAYPLTLLWIVGVTNAVNLIDGLDGLAAGLSAITCALLVFFAIFQGDAVMAVMMLGLLGALTGFLWFNFNPARVFMGDCGSQFLGFALATAGAMTANKAQTAVALSLPVLALGVPIFDTLLSMLRRFLGRRSLFAADRGHIHHRLLERGLGHRQTVLALYSLSLGAAVVGAVMVMVRDARTLWVFGGACLLLLGAFRICGVVKLRESLQKLASNRRHVIQTRLEHRAFEAALSRIQEAENFGSWWRALSLAAQELGVSWMQLTWEDRSGRPRRLGWSVAQQVPSTAVSLKATLSLKDRRQMGSMRLHVELPESENLEAQGRRMTLFARLVDEAPVFAPVIYDTPSAGFRARLRTVGVRRKEREREGEVSVGGV